jgi:hypothetical protein
LRDAVKEHFYPFVERRGFVRSKSRNPLFTVFRRTTSEAVHVFEVQWDKYGKPRFVINFGEAPPGGLDVGGAHVSANEVEPYHCATFGRLTRTRSSRSSLTTSPKSRRGGPRRSRGRTSTSCGALK